MKLTLELQLLPSPEQRQMLLDTMERYNAAATYAAEVGFKAKRFSQVTIHHLCYAELREKFGISAQMAVRAITKAVECFQKDKTKCPRFKKYGAMIYDKRFFSFKGPFAASLLTLQGRQIIPMIYGEYQKSRMAKMTGQVDLIFRQGKFFLSACIDLPDDAPITPKDFIGVDLGVVNIATTSDGTVYSGDKIEAVRQKYHTRRQTLGRKTAQRFKRRTRKNARRAMKRIKGKEANFRRNTNHCISKQLVKLAKDTGRGISLEFLKGIRKGRHRFRKAQRARLHGWSFAQLQSFIGYKGQLYGVPIFTADNRYTSQTCSQCGYCDKANRPSQSEFKCGRCGYTNNADLNAALNLRARAVANQPMVSEKHNQGNLVA